MQWLYSFKIALINGDFTTYRILDAVGKLSDISEENHEEL